MNATDKKSKLRRLDRQGRTLRDEQLRLVNGGDIDVNLYCLKSIPALNGQDVYRQVTDVITSGGVDL
jgi:hypothetical protein